MFMKTYLVLLCFLIIALYQAYSQSLGPESISANCHDNSGDSVSLAGTTGELMVGALSNDSLVLTQGVQQPLYTVTIIESKDLIYIWKYPITVYPNPTGNGIFITLGNSNEAEYLVKLYSIDGRLLQSQSINKDNNRVDLIEFKDTSVFLLKVIKENKIIRTYKIQKN